MEAAPTERLQNGCSPAQPKWLYQSRAGSAGSRCMHTRVRGRLCTVARHVDHLGSCRTANHIPPRSCRINIWKGMAARAAEGRQPVPPALMFLTSGNADSSQCTQDLLWQIYASTPDTF